MAQLTAGNIGNTYNNEYVLSVDRAKKRETLLLAVPFLDRVGKEMADRGYDAKEAVPRLMTAAHDLVFDVIEYCEPAKEGGMPTIVMKASVDADVARIYFVWNQSMGVDLMAIAKKEKEDLDALVGEGALSAELDGRADYGATRKAQGRLDGMSMGLALVAGLADRFDEFYDPVRKLKTVTLAVRRLKDGA
ncbi:MAG: hypothetical protein V1875_03320 [Candidatus Altiarchaeota archaeon]